ncbi:MAG: hypothetical protein LBQ87_06765 [Candidatus Fibromonas sp.]|jgi:hypothetical protein|nr:hypothetical protein [Candidatus Fibromonas sp.]
MKNRYLRTALLFLGIAGIVAYSLFPKEKNVECLEKDSMDFYPYGDSANGAAFMEMEPFAFKCILSNENGNCGIGFSFAENWNLMDSLVLEIQSSPDFKELVVQILTFDPDYTERSDRSTMKPFIKELKLSPGNKRYSISMEHFYVPDYWFVQQSAKNRHNAKRFYAITGMDIFSAWKNPANTELELKINSVCAVGGSNTPFVILIIYIGILIAIAISVRVRA